VSLFCFSPLDVNQNIFLAKDVEGTNGIVTTTADFLKFDKSIFSLHVILA